MIKMCEKGTHYWEENISVNICEKYVGKKIIFNSREKRKKINTKVGLQKKNGFLSPEGLIIDM